jgi:hypothetical protein
MNKREDMTIEDLDLYALKLFPSDNINKFVINAKDIVRLRKELKAMVPDEIALFYLIEILKNNIENNYRFPTEHCLRVIRKIIKNFPENFRFQPKTVRILFFLFRHYISHPNEVIQSCVNIFIKNQILSPFEINWLVENDNLSIHIINRLLRYPEKNKSIENWAVRVLESNKLEDRKSEVIGHLIYEFLPYNTTSTRSQNIWAIYYAKVPNNIKKKLLRELFHMDQFYEIFEVAFRLNYTDVCSDLIQFGRKRIEKRAEYVGQI